MKTVLRTGLLLAIALICLPVIFSGCATTGVRVPRVVDIADASLDTLATGMPIAEVRRMLGTPWSVDAMEFGAGVGEPWSGIVYEYLDGRDPRYAYHEHYFKTMLVFAESGADTLLNHWVVERKEASAFVSTGRSVANPSRMR